MLEFERSHVWSAESIVFDEMSSTPDVQVPPVTVIPFEPMVSVLVPEIDILPPADPSNGPCTTSPATLAEVSRIIALAPIPFVNVNILVDPVAESQLDESLKSVVVVEIQFTTCACALSQAIANTTAQTELNSRHFTGAKIDTIKLQLQWPIVHKWRMKTGRAIAWFKAP